MKRSLRRVLRPEERKEVQGVVYRGVGEDMDCSKESFKVLGNRWSGACWGFGKGERLEISLRAVFCHFALKFRKHGGWKWQETVSVYPAPELLPVVLCFAFLFA